MLPQHSSTHVFSRWFGLAYRHAVSGILRWGNFPFYPPASPFHWNRLQKSKARFPLGSSCLGFRETPTVGMRQWNKCFRLPNDRNGTGNYVVKKSDLQIIPDATKLSTRNAPLKTGSRPHEGDANEGDARGASSPSCRRESRGCAAAPPGGGKRKF